MEYKQVILVRADLKLPKGKMAAQVAHASVSAVLKSNKKKVNEWSNEGMKKVVLKVANKAELLKYRNHADNEGLQSALIQDAGRTVVEPGTMTCLGIGPDEEEKIDEITNSLKMV